MHFVYLVTRNGFKLLLFLLVVPSMFRTLDGLSVRPRKSLTLSLQNVILRNKRYTMSIPKMHLCERTFQRCGLDYGGCGGHCPPGRRIVCSRSRGYCITLTRG